MDASDRSVHVIMIEVAVRAAVVVSLPMLLLLTMSRRAYKGVFWVCDGVAWVCPRDVDFPKRHLSVSL